MQGEISETKKPVEIRIHCDAEDAEKKVNCLVELLKEANALVDELASKGIKFKIDLDLHQPASDILDKS